jgi:hypothetical protein
MERSSLVILSFKNEPGQGLIKPWFCLMERLIKAIKKAVIMMINSSDHQPFQG